MPVEKPPRYDLNLWFDLSPVRPWEWGGIEADAWTEAVQYRGAVADGIADAREEAGMAAQLERMPGRPVA